MDLFLKKHDTIENKTQLTAENFWNVNSTFENL